YRDDVRDEIVVREHHALWRAGRPGGVNYRRKVATRDRRHLVFEKVWIFLQILSARVFKIAQQCDLRPAFLCIVEEDHPLQALDRLNTFFCVLPKLFARQEEHLRTRVLENVAYLIDRLS